MFSSNHALEISKIIEMLACVPDCKKKPIEIKFYYNVAETMPM